VECFCAWSFALSEYSFVSDLHNDFLDAEFYGARLRNTRYHKDVKGTLRSHFAMPLCDPKSIVALVSNLAHSIFSSNIEEHWRLLVNSS
jgi:hypothetical protein